MRSHGKPRKPASPERRAQILAEMARDRELRQKGYRDQALRLLPHVCASCGREFSDRNVSELTVHHRDGNFKNNPPDGGNWELLCVYCHDHEHEKTIDARWTSASPGGAAAAPSTFTPFDGLDSLLK